MLDNTIYQPDLDMLPGGRLNTKAAARYLGLSPKTLATMRCQGTGPKFIKPGRIFYFQCDLDAWIDSAEKCVSTAQARLNQ